MTHPSPAAPVKTVATVPSPQLELQILGGRGKVGGTVLGDSDDVDKDVIPARSAPPLATKGVIAVGVGGGGGMTSNHVDKNVIPPKSAPPLAANGGGGGGMKSSHIHSLGRGDSWFADGKAAMRINANSDTATKNKNNPPASSVMTVYDSKSPLHQNDQQYPFPSNNFRQVSRLRTKLSSAMNEDGLVTELHWTFRGCLLVFMLLCPLSNLYYFTLAPKADANVTNLTERVELWNVQHFHVYMVLPIALLSCALAVCSQPKYGFYTRLVIIVGFLASYGSAILELIGNYRAENKFFIKIGYPWFMMICVFPPLWWSLRHIHRKIAELPPEKLSLFLVDSIGIQVSSLTLSFFSQQHLLVNFFHPLTDTHFKHIHFFFRDLKKQFP